MEQIFGLKPIIDNDCEIIILGSMPGVKSREVGFYYSNPTNRFWKIMSFLQGKDFCKMSYEERAKELLKCHVALFDLYSSCRMRKDGSSLDSNIYCVVMNNIPQLIKGTKIKKVYVTSKKAYDDLVKHYGKALEEDGIESINLPSPSSANRSKYKTDDQLMQAWAELLK